MQPRYFTFLISFISLSTPLAAQTNSPFELWDGDRVLFVGDGLFEVALDYGWIEYALTTQWPDRRLTFRNIGWSGDTPVGASRDHFTNPPTPYEHLLEQITTTQPTVAFVGYGANLGYEPDDAIGPFMQDLTALLDTLAAHDVRIVLVSPAPHEPEISPAPDPAAINAKLRHVSEQLASLSDDRGYPFVDLFGALYPAAVDPTQRITQNSIHLNEQGYKRAAAALESQLDLPARPRDWTIPVGDPVPFMAAISNLIRTDDHISFSLSPPVLPLPGDNDNRLNFSVQGLPGGHFLLKIDGREIATASSREFAAGVKIPHPLETQADRVRRLILEKNELFFRQYRPQNETYLVGFRSYEQGQNARELQMLDAFIGEKENDIGRWRIPRDVAVELVRVD